MGLADWNGECSYIKGLLCPHPAEWYTTNWICYEHCELLKKLVTKTENMITIKWGKVEIVENEF